MLSYAYCYLFHECYMPRHLILLDFITLIIVDEEQTLVVDSVSFCKNFTLLILFSLLDLNIFLSALFPYTHNLWSPSRLRDGFLLPLRTGVKLRCYIFHSVLYMGKETIKICEVNSSKRSLNFILYLELAVYV
jgi:hypothetical protein